MLHPPTPQPSDAPTIQIPRDTWNRLCGLDKVRLVRLGCSPPDESPAQRAKELAEATPGMKPASEIDTNGETKPVPIEYDTNGQPLLPYMQGGPLDELPTT